MSVFVRVCVSAGFYSVLTKNIFSEEPCRDPQARLFVSALQVLQLASLMALLNVCPRLTLCLLCCCIMVENIRICIYSAFSDTDWESGKKYISKLKSFLDQLISSV